MLTTLTRLSFVVLLITATLALNGCKKEEPKPEPPKPAAAAAVHPVSADEADKVLIVTGMTCSGCEGSVNRAIAALPGVEGVSASHVDKKAYIKLAADASVTDEQLIAAINAVPGDRFKASAAN